MSLLCVERGGEPRSHCFGLYVILRCGDVTFCAEAQTRTPPVCCNFMLLALSDVDPWPGKWPVDASSLTAQPLADPHS